MRIAIVGTRGIPAAYGGFETLAWELSTRLADRGHEVTVYCRNERTDESMTIPANVRRRFRPVSYAGMSTRVWSQSIDRPIGLPRGANGVRIESCLTRIRAGTPSRPCPTRPSTARLPAGNSMSGLTRPRAVTAGV